MKALSLWQSIQHRFEQRGECLIWTGAKNPEGYGHIGRSERGQVRYFNVHQVAYAALVGPVSSGQELDHLCRNPACAAIAHLQPVSSRENSLRGRHPNFVTHRTGVCRRGHLIAGENLRACADGRKRCRRCGLDAAARQASRRVVKR